MIRATFDWGLRARSGVARALDLPPSIPAVVVGGTNGKGSVCALLEAALRASGLRVGCYGSPHLFRFHERIRIDGVEVDDDSLLSAFEAVDEARRALDEELTYFEFATLAALWIFARARPDAMVLEVGLGGRLDAVNLVDAEVAAITNIALDHIEYLGGTRDSIGREKAGVLRRGRAAVCGDKNPPRVLRTRRGKSARRFAISARISILRSLPITRFRRAVRGDFAVAAWRLICRRPLCPAFAKRKTRPSPSPRSKRWPSRSPICASTRARFAKACTRRFCRGGRKLSPGRRRLLSMSLTIRTRRRRSPTIWRRWDFSRARPSSRRCAPKKRRRIFSRARRSSRCCFAFAPAEDGFYPPDRLAEAARAAGIEARACADYSTAAAAARSSDRIVVCGSFAAAGAALANGRETR